MCKEGTVCSSCYAGKTRGNFRFKNVQAAYERRYQKFKQADGAEWVKSMSYLIMNQTSLAAPFFRVFDSGDLDSVKQMEAWADVAEAAPQVGFWLATREKAMVRRYFKDRELPANLLVRVSADMIDGKPPKGFATTSTVKSGRTLDQWQKLVQDNDDEQWYCPAPLQDNRCDECRACWSADVHNVTYRKH